MQLQASASARAVEPFILHAALCGCAAVQGAAVQSQAMASRCTLLPLFALAEGCGEGRWVANIRSHFLDEFFEFNLQSEFDYHPWQVRVPGLGMKLQFPKTEKNFGEIVVFRIDNISKTCLNRFF
jgi:hypothetical protein